MGRHRKTGSEKSLWGAFRSDQPVEGTSAKGALLKREINFDSSQLVGLRSTDGFGSYISRIWEYRAFIAFDAKSKAFRTTSNYRLWRFWLIAQPVLDGVMYGLIFGLILRTARDIDNFVGYLILGVTFFNFLTKLVNSGVGIVKTSQNLIDAFSFPRACVAFSQMLRYTYDLLPSAAIAIVVALLAQWGTWPTWRILAVVPLLLLLLMFGGGLHLILARITAFVPDIGPLVDAGMRAWFFVSGVFFSVSRYVDHPFLIEVMTLNPAYQFLQAIRGAVMYASLPSLGVFASICAWSFGTFLFGFWFFWRAEERYVTVER